MNPLSDTSTGGAFMKTIAYTPLCAGFQDQFLVAGAMWRRGSAFTATAC
jgi:hypothetical protein